MKSCYRCGTPWTGYGAQPRAREVCEGCGAYFHTCANCHHFDTRASSCSLEHTYYIGPRDALNYCEEFRMIDTVRKAAEKRVETARSRWEALFGG